ncbi:MAG TPA: hypothetical protein PKV56_14535 [Burkholderiaceae bacterium]|nr:hypothetical protein [Burkholderiaceae bacterium]
MSAHPLTHHEILGLIGPFTRRGRHLDLPASDRLARRLVFKPIEHADPAIASSTLIEGLQLEQPEDDTYRLTRTLALPCGLQATLQTDGTDPAELLARIEAIPLQRQFQRGAGYAVALCHRLDATKGGPAAALMVLTRATARIEGLRLAMKVPAVTGIPADIELEAAHGDSVDLPQDLLAVLGWSWARLVRVGKAWTCSLRLRGSGPQRSRDAEAKLERTAQHLAQTLSEPPPLFHDRRVAARWGVVVRRSIPLLVTVSLIGLAAAVPSMGLSENSVLRMVIFQSPPLLLGLVFCMRELPQIEIPPWPRRPSQSAWGPQRAQASVPR